MRVGCALLLVLAPLEPTVAQYRVHSDLPLFTHNDEELSPRSFHERNGDELSFGCAHRVTMGDWKYVEPDSRRAPNTMDAAAQLRGIPLRCLRAVERRTIRPQEE